MELFLVCIAIVVSCFKQVLSGFLAENIFATSGRDLLYIKLWWTKQRHFFIFIFLYLIYWYTAKQSGHLANFGYLLAHI